MKVKKSRSRKIKSILDSGWAAFFGNLALILAFIILAVWFDKLLHPENVREAGPIINFFNHYTIRPYMLVVDEAFKDGVAVSVIIADVVLIFVSRILKKIDNSLEEEIKSNADHHAIIRDYKAYKNTMELDVMGEPCNYISKNGERLLCWQYTNLEKLKRHSDNPKRKIKLTRRILKEYLAYAGKKNVNIKKVKEQIETYIEGDAENNIPPGIVEIPDVCLFVNRQGMNKEEPSRNLKVVFDDDTNHHELPDFIEAHAVEIMNAHKTSKAKNKFTMRLKGLDYNKDTNTLILNTERTNYIHMMLTNRCMDFPLANGVSVRSLYEYREFVQPLDKTVLGNQVGVEGLIITRDGYTLIEKRSHNQKTTWRDKFAQPISLSMSCEDLGIKESKPLIGGGPKDAEEAIYKMLKKHLEGYGIYEGEYSFNISENFLGISRDLVEGGKPNVYFYVVVDMDHKKLEEKLIERAKIDPTEPVKDKKAPEGKVKDDNLKKRLYLYPIWLLNFNFNYIMKMDMRIATRVCRYREYDTKNCDMFLDKVERILWNISQFIHNNTDKAKMIWRRLVRILFVLFKKDSRYGLYTKECGEAFLGCLAFYRMCQERIDAELTRMEAEKIRIKKKYGDV
ncbi:MAG: hypothetical protein Q4D29_06270 [Lachnospiraceae bacterium]|nr:hypothetical protein [Lachnospiraceae bacterium]